MEVVLSQTDRALLKDLHFQLKKLNDNFKSDQGEEVLKSQKAIVNRLEKSIQRQVQ